MRRRAIVTFAITAAVLVITAAPVSAAGESATLSTSEQFANGTTNPGTVVDPVDDQVDYTEVYFESFEDQTPLSEWVADSSSNADVTVVDSPAAHGDQAVKLETSGFAEKASINTTQLGRNVQPGRTVTLELRPDSEKNAPKVRFAIQNSSTYYQVLVDYNNNELKLQKVVDGSKNTLASDSATLNETVGSYGDLILQWDSGGSMTVYYDASGAYASLSASLTEWTTGPLKVQLVDFGSGTESVYVDAIRHADQDTATYTSPGLGLSGAGKTYVHLPAMRNASATVTWQGYDGSSWVDLRSDTYSSAGNYTVSVDSNYDEYRAKVTWNESGGRSSGTLAELGAWWTDHKPVVVDSSASPSGNTLTNDRTPKLSVRVEDPDLQYPRGDDVDVEIRINGIKVATKTITSNTTVSFEPSSEVDTGQSTWNATATDSYGKSDDGAGWVFRVPGVLTLWNESAPNNKVTSDVTVTLVERDGGASTTFTTSDGTVEMKNIPDSELIAVISPSSGYYDRRLIIPPDKNSDGYLLPKNETAAKIVFALRDNTGQFPPKESALYIEKVLTKNGNTSFRTIASDTFGATETVVMVLEDRERYAIRVGNDAGDMRELGSYTTAGDARAPLPVGKIQINAGAGTARVAQATLVENETGSKAIRFVYLDTGEDTAELELRIERADGTVVYPNNTVSGPFGSYSLTEPINFTENRTWFVNYTAYDSNGNVIKGESIPVNGLGGTTGGIPWSDRVRRLTGWGLVLMFTGFVVIKQVHMAPAAGTGTAALLTIAGVLQLPLPILGIAGAFSVITLVGGESA